MHPFTWGFSNQFTVAHYELSRCHSYKMFAAIQMSYANFPRLSLSSCCVRLAMSRLDQHRKTLITLMRMDVYVPLTCSWDRPFTSCNTLVKVLLARLPLTLNTCLDLIKISSLLLKGKNQEKKFYVFIMSGDTHQS